MVTNPKLVLDFKEFSYKHGTAKTKKTQIPKNISEFPTNLSKKQREVLIILLYRLGIFFKTPMILISCDGRLGTNDQL